MRAVLSLVAIVVLLPFFLAIRPTVAADAPLAPGMKVIDERTVAGPVNFFDGIEPSEPGGDVNAVIEIPTGTTAKWEIDPKDGRMRWEIKGGKPRIVDYQGGYPANYGAIPRTMLPSVLKGEAELMDVIVVGAPIPRGTVAKVKLVGILRLQDGSEKDDKLLAVARGTPEFQAASARELDERFGGVCGRIEAWFRGYKGPDAGIKTFGYGSAEEARQLFEAGVKSFRFGR